MMLSVLMVWHTQRGLGPGSLPLSLALLLLGPSYQGGYVSVGNLWSSPRLITDTLEALIPCPSPGVAGSWFQSLTSRRHRNPGIPSWHRLGGEMVKNNRPSHIHSFPRASPREAGRAGLINFIMQEGHWGLGRFSDSPPDAKLSGG